MESAACTRSLVLVLALCVAGGGLSLAPGEPQGSPSPGDDHPVFSTPLGNVRGTRRTIPLDFTTNTTIPVVDEVLGVPYARPPVGDLRFKRPLAASPWRGVRDGTRHAPVCPQSATEDGLGRTRQSEDCLYLNVYTPYEASAPASRVYPVMLFIHGGSYFYGSGNRYNGSAIAQFGVVFVAINYRLGALGFMSSGSTAMPGNYGLYDQLAALRWVRDNIRAFRGDPGRVTVYGSSAGGASVGLLLLSPLTDGLFHGAIAQSGTANAMWATHEDELTLRYNVATFARHHDCYDSDEERQLACLRRVPYDRFRASHVYTILSSTEVDPLFKPRVDGEILPGPPAQLLRQGAFSTAVPYMTGTVRAEFGDYYGDEFPQAVLEQEVDAFLAARYTAAPAVTATIQYEYVDWGQYRAQDTGASAYLQQYNRAQVLSDLGLLAPTAQMADQLAAKEGQKVFLYYLDHYVSYHSVELNHVFGVPWLLPAAGGSQPAVDELGMWTDMDGAEDRARSEVLMLMWTNFAKYGEPTPADFASPLMNTTWRATPPVNLQYLAITASKTHTTYTMRPHLFAHRVALWNLFIPELVRLGGGGGGAGGGNASGGGAGTPGGDSRTWAFFGVTVAFLGVVVTLLCACVVVNRKGKKYKHLFNRHNSAASGASVNL